MPAYLLAEVKWHDLAMRDDYVAQIQSTLDLHGGRIINLPSVEPLTLEGEWTPLRLVVIEFATMDALKNWYDSQEYAPLKRLREHGARSNLVAVEGKAVAPTSGSAPTTPAAPSPSPSAQPS
ncbi:MAG: DUF1330 domain-containing protein [Thermoplasmata archaeon]